MKKILLLLVSLFVITSSYAGKWDNYKTGYYAMVYSVSEDGNMYCSLSKEYKSEVGDILSQRSFTVYTDETADIQVNLTGDSRFQLTRTPTATEAYSTYARAYIYYTFDVTDLEPSSTPHTATITITRGDQVITCSLSETYLPEPDPTAGPVLDGEFSVSATNKVKFTRGNLYWNGSDWAMESAQERVKTTWRTDHIGLLNWGSAENAIATSGSYDESQLFCDGSDDAHKLTLEDAAGLYAMDKDQWNYLLFTRANASNLYKYPVTVNGVSSCMVIAPDNYEGTIDTYYSQSEFLAAQANGLVCLPPPGSRYGTSVYASGFQYWTSTFNNEAWANAYYMHATNSDDIEVVTSYITNSYGIRLVQDVASVPGTDPSLCAHEHLTRHVAVESTDLVQGHNDYDECDDCGACFALDDTEHENALTAADFLLPLDTEPIHYFYIQNRDYVETKVIWMVDGISLEYSYDKENWNVSTGNDPLAAEGRIYYRATRSGNTFFGAIDAGSAFAVGNGFNCPRCVYSIGGDVTTLLRSNGKVSVLPEPSYLEEWNGEGYEPVLRGVFENFCKGDTYGMLSDISELLLPSTVLTERCYRNMFATNPGIHSAGPIISAVTMAPHSCESMFEGTNGLAEVPQMIVETLADYSCARMFAGCSNLTSVRMAPTVVAPHSCEWMFYDCINLETTPSLPATTLAVDCYNSMFYNCWAITQAPELPAPSLVDGCYVQMFYGCQNLQSISVGMQTEWPVKITNNELGGYNEYDYYCTRDWVVGVNTEGTFTGNPSLFKGVYPGNSLYSVVPQYWNSARRLTIPVTISAAGYTTFCYDYNWTIPEGTEGYVGYVNNNGFFCFEKAYDAGDEVQSYRSPYDTYVEGQLVQQWVCKAVVLKGKPGVYDVALTTSGVSDYIDQEDPKAKNQLLGTMYDFDTSLYRSWDDGYYGWSDGDYYFYALSLDATGKNVGFYWMENDGAPFVTKPYKAFLRVKKDLVSPSSKRALIFDDAVSTGINETTIAKEEKKDNGAIFDLSGRRLNSIGKSGIYIINGKKVVK